MNINILGLLVETSLCEMPEKKEGHIKTFVNLSVFVKKMNERGFVSFSQINARGERQLGVNKEGVKPRVERQMTKAEKEAAAAIFEDYGVACIQIAAKLKQ